MGENNVLGMTTTRERRGAHQHQILTDLDTLKIIKINDKIGNDNILSGTKMPDVMKLQYGGGGRKG